MLQKKKIFRKSFGGNFPGVEAAAGEGANEGSAGGPNYDASTGSKNKLYGKI